MIARHYKETRMDFLLEDINEYEELLLIGINTIKTQNAQDVLGGSIQNAINAFGEAVLAEVPHQQIVRYLQHIKEFGSANFAFACRQGETFDVTINNDTFGLTGGPAGAYLHTDVWEKVFYAAVTLRDKKAIEQLIQVPKSVFDNANISADAFDTALINLMKGLFEPEANMGDLLEAALIAADPNAIASGRRRYVQHILLPLLPVYRCIYTTNAQDEFNEAMVEALEAHKKYWKKDKMEQQGWISLPLIAAASHAYDLKGYQLTVKTDYIPDFLVKNDFDVKEK
ncbi:immunity 49 family protein [Pseudoalteromonas carrageenovora]|uniref:immunity 49 family protein n=1 Tax=Pseudoalteromonas carrageenovora TaxID=227 RepID=UPI00311E9FC5